MAPAGRRPRQLWLAAVLTLALLPPAVAGPSVVAARSERPGPTAASGRQRPPAPPAFATTVAEHGANPPKPRSDRPLRVLVSGDVLIHNTVWEAARTAEGFDFGPQLAELRPVVSHVDLALCHLETPLAPADGPFSTYPRFSAPPQIAEALRRTGYDACTTASNHSVDQGTAGVNRTLDALDAAGLGHTGTARSRTESDRITTFTARGMTLAWLAYTYGTNGLPIDGRRPWSVNLIDERRILADAARARRAGADAVLVALHWGQEYQSAPSAEQRALAERLTRSPDITAIYGHHAHVVQPIERINGTWVVFGLGNLLADQATIAPGVDDGLMVRLVFRRGPDGRVRVVGRPGVVATRIVRDGGPHVVLAGDE